MLHRLMLFSLALLVACGSALQAQTTTTASGVRYFMGQIRDVGQGRIRSWVSTDANGSPLAVGVSFTPGVLNGLPTTRAEYQLTLPSQAASTGFDHFAMNWYPMGHIPANVYSVPHFDFHFYTITPTVRTGITATGADLERVRRTPPIGAVPPGYIFAQGGEEPRMGAHWVNPNSPEFQGQPFTQTLIYGFYNGSLAFIEPMASLSYLRTRPLFFAPMAVPTFYPRSAYYPTGYKVGFDQSTGQYTVALYGMALR
ncbi:MAG: DUF5602 domain-containing protein [Armatimonadota bacterium]